MAQKLILCDGVFGVDLLGLEPLSALVDDGYEVKSVSGVVTPDSRPMCFVLLEEAAAEESGDDSGDDTGTDDTGTDDTEEPTGT